MSETFIWNDHIFYTKVNKDTPRNRVIVSLSNGLTIFEDDGIPNQDPFWIRLNKLIKSSDATITSLRYQVGRYTQNFPSNQLYYYYMKRLYGNLGDSMMKEIKVGYSEDGKKFNIYKYGHDGGKEYVETLSKNNKGIIKNF